MDIAKIKELAEAIKKAVRDDNELMALGDSYVQIAFTAMEQVAPLNEWHERPMLGEKNWYHYDYQETPWGVHWVSVSNGKLEGDFIHDGQPVGAGTGDAEEAPESV